MSKGYLLSLFCLVIGRLISISSWPSTCVGSTLVAMVTTATWSTTNGLLFTKWRRGGDDHLHDIHRRSKKRFSVSFETSSGWRYLSFFFLFLLFFKLRHREPAEFTFAHDTPCQYWNNGPARLNQHAPLLTSGQHKRLFTEFPLDATPSNRPS